MYVKDIMTTPVLGIARSAGIVDAIRLMLAKRISGLPVLEADGRIAGMITEGDFLRRAELGTEAGQPRWYDLFTGAGRLAGAYARTHGRNVEEVMSTSPITVTGGTPLGDAVELMTSHHIRRLPVIEGDKVIGIVSRSDLMRALAGLLPSKATPNLEDAAIREAIRTELARHDWNSAELTGIEVKDGVVVLEGMIFDERQRAAMRVAAENVPGVKAVSDHLVWIEPMSGMVVRGPADREPPLIASGTVAKLKPGLGRGGR